MLLHIRLSDIYSRHFCHGARWWLRQYCLPTEISCAANADPLPMAWTGDCLGLGTIVNHTNIHVLNCSYIDLQILKDNIHIRTRIGMDDTVLQYRKQEIMLLLENITLEHQSSNVHGFATVSSSKWYPSGYEWDCANIAHPNGLAICCFLFMLSILHCWLLPVNLAVPICGSYCISLSGPGNIPDKVGQ